MIRILTIAAIAAALSATAVQAEEGIAVTLKDKSPQQIRSEIHAAAHTLCERDSEGATYRQMAIDSCVRDSTRKAWAEAQLKLAKMKALEFAKN